MGTNRDEATGGLETGWLRESDSDVKAIEALAATITNLEDYPHAHSVATNVLEYEADVVHDAARQPERRRDLQAEMARALMHGPGVLAVRGAFDPSVVDRATAVFEELLASERRQRRAHGDHFAPPGANERMWDALGKLAVTTPTTFADYYANQIVAVVAEAWLGPGYQLTSAVNIVNPGGKAQAIHCDYHLGFLSGAAAARYPAHIHRLSQGLTLQGAIAHVDMPVESGPTMYLPYSQRYLPVYLAWRNPAVGRFAESHAAQPALAKGDAVFFNPGLLHAAGHNRTTSCRRMANLLQVSSAFGRAMESVDRTAMVEAIFPVLADRRKGGASESWLRAVVASCAEAYPFPTNLDRDEPVDSLAPPSQADLVWQALDEEWSLAALRDALADQDARRRAEPGDQRGAADTRGE